MKNKIPCVLSCILAVAIGCSGFVEAQTADNDRVSMPAGEFIMGDTYCADEQSNSDWCNDEIPHKVKLDSFLIDKYEVSNSEYGKCFEDGVCGPNELHESRPQDFNQPRQPVVFVTWEDAQTYCQWKGGRLPTEAEWERAAQGKDFGGAHFGKKYDQGAPRNVGELSPNFNGIFDMMGNVYEWTLDWYGPVDASGVQGNPRGPDAGKDKVIRGGAWNSPAHYLRVSDRVARSPELRYSDVGFRCVMPSK